MERRLNERIVPSRHRRGGAAPRIAAAARRLREDSRHKTGFLPRGSVRRVRRAVRTRRGWRRCMAMPSQ